MPRDRLLVRAGALDRALFSRVAEGRTPALDRILPRLSWAGNHSGIWIACAGALAAFGGESGRRAALRGYGAIAVTSGLVNLGVKRAVRRPRPELQLVPEARRMRRQPVTTSFPSGHAASATAFATGVALERPGAGLALAPLAAAVAYSRVYVGVHYPGDVGAGAVIGIAVAAGLRQVGRSSSQPS